MSHRRKQRQRQRQRQLAERKNRPEYSRHRDAKYGLLFGLGIGILIFLYLSNLRVAVVFSFWQGTGMGFLIWIQGHIRRPVRFVPWPLATGTTIGLLIVLVLRSL